MANREKQPNLDAFESRLLDSDDFTRDVMNYMYGKSRDVTETIDLSFVDHVAPVNPVPDDTAPGQVSES